MRQVMGVLGLVLLVVTLACTGGEQAPAAGEQAGPAAEAPGAAQTPGTEVFEDDFEEGSTESWNQEAASTNAVEDPPAGQAAPPPPKGSTD